MKAPTDSTYHLPQTTGTVAAFGAISTLALFFGLSAMGPGPEAHVVVQRVAQPAPAPEPVVETLNLGRATAPIASVNLKPKKRKVLVVGDSHSAGTFGQALDLLLKSMPNVEVLTLGNCGVSPDAYLGPIPVKCGSLTIDGDDISFRRRVDKVPSLAELLATEKPDLTIVQLGANQINTATRKPNEAAQDVFNLASLVSVNDSKCLWVGPPYGSNAAKPFSKMNHLYGVMEQAMPSSCELLDSRPSALPYLDYEALTARAHRVGDGRHFDAIGLHGKNAARRWALDVFEQARGMLGPDGTLAVRLASVKPRG